MISECQSIAIHLDIDAVEICTRMIEEKCDPQDVVKLLAKHKFSVNEGNKRCMTPLMVAAQVGHVTLVEYICRYLPVLVNLGDRLGRTAAYFAAEHSNQRVAIAMLRELFVKGAHFNISCRIEGAPTAIQAARRKRLFATATYLHNNGALGPFDENEICKSIEPNIRIAYDDSDDDTEEMPREDEEENTAPDNKRRKT